MSSLRRGGLGGILGKALYFLNQTVKYQSWVTRNDRLTKENRQLIATHIDAMSYRPVFSVLMPVCNPNPVHLQEAIESIVAQLYPNWELCIADDASDNPGIAQLIETIRERDGRIKFVRRSNRGHISAASNSCLEMACGEFVALLDHDDLLAPQALYMAARALNQRSDLSLIYSDEDKINESGVRTWPHFKPNWNPDLMRSQNAVNHVGIYRTAVVRAIDGFRIGVEGCQDWDLALRVSEHIPATQILHLPYVLYHWRITPQSTALGTSSKGYVTRAGKKVIADHLNRMGECADVLPMYGAYFRVQYRLETPPPVAVISKFDTWPMFERLIHSLVSCTDYPDLALCLLVDPEQKTQMPQVQQRAEALGLKLTLVDCAENSNHAERINLSVSRILQPVLCILDPDCVPLTSGWLLEMVSHAMRSAIGAVGAKLLYPNGSIYSAGTLLGLGLNRVAGSAYTGASKGERGAAGRAVLIQNYSAISVRCMVIRRDVLLESNGFDPSLPLTDFADIDLCLRLGELGFRTLWTPFSELVWHGPKSESGEVASAVKTLRSRWEKLLDADPAHNPNLSLNNSFPMLAPAPRVPHCSIYQPELVETW